MSANPDVNKAEFVVLLLLLKKMFFMYQSIDHVEKDVDKLLEFYWKRDQRFFSTLSYSFFLKACKQKAENAFESVFVVKF